MIRWMLIGIHVAFAKALQNATIEGAVSGVTSAGGLIMKVSHEFAMNITIVPKTFRRIPSPQWAYFAAPSLHRSHP